MFVESINFCYCFFDYDKSIGKGTSWSVITSLAYLIEFFEAKILECVRPAQSIPYQKETRCILVWVISTNKDLNVIYLIYSVPAVMVRLNSVKITSSTVYYIYTKEQIFWTILLRFILFCFIKLTQILPWFSFFFETSLKAEKQQHQVKPNNWLYKCDQKIWRTIAHRHLI